MTLELLNQEKLLNPDRAEEIDQLIESEIHSQLYLQE